MESTKIRAHILVSGKVQGVYFRGSAQDAARRMGVAGWARNLPDRRVEIVCEGKRESVETFLEWCRQGPPSARVDDVSVEFEAPHGGFDDFCVR